MDEFENVMAEIKERITAGDLAAGLRMLLDLLSGFEREMGSEDVNVVRVQSGEFNQLQRDRSAGVVPYDDMERRRASLASRILGHIDFVTPRLSKVRLPREIRTQPGKSQVAPPATRQLEELIGGYLMSLSWMEYGLEAAKAVCKIEGPFNVGTGFRVGRDWLVTNNHVLPNADIARQATATFNFEEAMRGGARKTSSYGFDSDSFVTDEALDCSIVRVKENSSEPPLKQWGALVLRGAAPLKTNDPVIIIQHPLGAPKKIGILHNYVMSVEAPFVYYTTDTMRGSSGSPVLDTKWSVAALHRAAGEWSQPQGRYLNNQGVLVSEIAKSRNLQSVMQELLSK